MRTLARIRVAAGVAAVAAVVVAAVALGAGAADSAAGVTGAAHRDGWSGPRTLAPASQYTFSPALAVNERGAAIAGWFGGSPPLVYSGPPPGPGPGSTSSPLWTGSQVVVDLGTVTGGFRAPVVLATDGSDQAGQMQVALSGAGVAYAAWSTSASGRWMIATARGGRFSMPRPLALPPLAQVQGLVSGRQGPVAVWWLEYGVRSAPALRYALLDAAGRRGRAVTVARLGSPLSTVELAINDHGAVVASWLNEGRPFGAHPRLRAALCTPRRRCGSAQTIVLGRALGQYANLATTLSDDGTAVLMAGGFDDVGKTVRSVRQVPRGLWAAVSRRGHRFVATPLIAATGDNPVAAAVGRHGAVVIFNVGAPPVTALAWSRLEGGRAGFTTPVIVPDRHTLDSPVLAANLRGSFVAAWDDPSGHVIGPASYSLAAAINDRQGLGPPDAIAPGSAHLAGKTLAAGIDGRGDAIVIWSDWVSGRSHGVFAAIHRR